MNYKVLAVGGHEVGSLEAMLNGYAAEGWKVLYFFESNNRLIGILEQDLSHPVTEKSVVWELVGKNNNVVGEPIAKKVGWPKGKPRKVKSEDSTISE